MERSTEGQVQLQNRMREKAYCYSKKLVNWVVLVVTATTAFGFLLAFYCVYRGFLGALGWVAGMVSGGWAALGTVGGFYLSMAKSDHREGGITFESAKANGFVKRDL